MEGSGVAVASVVGYPHGSTTTGAKLYEARDLLRRGVKEIDAVLNAGKMLSRQFPYVEMELTQLAQACRETGAVVKIVFENRYLPQDLKTIGCRLAKRAEVDLVSLGTHGALNDEDLALFRRLLNDKAKMKAGWGVATLADLFHAYESGCDRVETNTTAAILDEWKAELARRKAAEAAPAPVA
jgi:deoxyribose-phosphate aldolase